MDTRLGKPLPTDIFPAGVSIQCPNRCDAAAGSEWLLTLKYRDWRSRAFSGAQFGSDTPPGKTTAVSRADRSSNRWSILVINSSARRGLEKFMFRHVEGYKAQYGNMSLMVAHDFVEWHVIVIKPPTIIIQGCRQFSEAKALAVCGKTP